MAYAHQRGCRGRHAHTAVSTLKRSGKMCAREVECNGTSCARVEVKRKRYHKRPFPTSRRNLRHMQDGCTCCKSSQKWYYSTKKWCNNTKKVKNLYSRKKLAFFTLTLPPNPPGGCSAFSLQFIPFRIVFFGRSPLKTDALSIAWYVICLSKSINYY